MPENRQSNYDQVIENWRLKFLEMDQEELIRKFQLEADEEFLYIIYFSKRFRIDRKNGFITEDGKSPGFDTVMNIYNTFYYSAAHPVASGNLVAFRQVKRVYPFEAAYRRTIIFRLQELFAGKTEELRKACEALGGTLLPQGDVGYVLPVFPFLNIAVLFWDKDEEFEAQANMLFDSEITEFMHEENVVGVAADAVYYLTLAAGMMPEKIYAQ
ncbi:DUF3786 domain-containing protein [Blautia faecis]|uniref:DUF3786 domain-containing protein n=1 Tax=Blautia TaxID=572511 RepID=UPI00156E7520|nr:MULTISPECIES: DUF3786 domain-containing protein [Blautia]MCB5522376.1 DUF3786 domain-containing protein [Blautia schinkii]NSD60221.1 DUF3786 domain-containing protein [Blautia faecis]